MDEVRQMAAVALVLVLLALTLWWLRRRGIAGMVPARRQGRKLECLERLALGPHHSLHLVRLGETALLVASSPGGCALVRSFPCEEIDRREGVR